MSYDHIIDYEMFYVTNEFFQWERSLYADDVVFECTNRRYWVECIEITNQDHVIMNHQGYRTMYLCLEFE